MVTLGHRVPAQFSFLFAMSAAFLLTNRRSAADLECLRGLSRDISRCFEKDLCAVRKKGHVR